MRFPALLTLAAASLAPVAAMASGSNHVCNYQLHYDVELEDDDVRLKDDGDVAIEMQRGRLWIDGREQTLSDSERRQMLAYGEGMKQFTHDVTKVALQGVQLGMECAALAISTLTGKDNSAEMTRHLDAMRAQLAERLDGHHLPADVLGDEFDAEINSAVESITADAIEEMGASMGRLMMLAIVAPSRLEARTERMEKVVEAQMEKRSAELERQADGLCSQARKLDQIENSLGKFDAFEHDEPSV